MTSPYTFLTGFNTAYLNYEPYTKSKEIKEVRIKTGLERFLERYPNFRGVKRNGN